MIEREFIRDAKKALLIKEFLKKKFRRALISSIDIIETPLVTRIIIKAARPALVIGRKGANIRAVTEEIRQKFGVENPQIEVVPVENPTLDAQVQAMRIALALEAGMAWRPLIRKTLARIMAAGAKGAEIVIAGKLGARGAKSRKERVYAGYMKKVGDPAKLVDVGRAQALTRWGVIGVTVRIVHPDVRFPDEIVVGGAKIEGEGAATEEHGGTQAEA